MVVMIPTKCTQFFSNDVLLPLDSWLSGGYAACVEQLHIRAIQPLQHMAVGHRLKIFSVTKEENMKHSIVCACFKYLFSVTESSHFDVTDFIVLNWLCFNLGSVFTCWDNV